MDYALIVRRLGCLLLAAIIWLPATAQETNNVFGAWQLHCESSDCRIRQGLANPNQPDIVFGSEIQYLAGGDQAMLTLSFPLGIYLPAGIGLKVGNQTRDVPVTVCLPIGCQAIVEIDEALAKSLQSEKDYQVRFYTTQSAPNEITFSLDGYGEAQRRLVAVR